MSSHKPADLAAADAVALLQVEGPSVLRNDSAAEEFFELSLDHVCVAGFDGYFKRLSPSWTRTLGWTVEEMMTRPSAEFVHPEDRALTLAGRARLQNGAPLGPLVNRYLCKDGGYRWFQWNSVAHSDRALVYASARDISEQKQAEGRLVEAAALQEQLQRQLVFADRMASVGTLAAGVAHEINNPLSYVTANIALIIEELRRLSADFPSQRVAELSQMALEAQVGAERIRKVVRGLTTFSRAEEERRAALDVRPLVELAVDMTRNEISHRARLVKDYGPMPLVDADEAHLGQVFINLLVNAAQAIPDGQSDAHEIRIVTSTASDGRACIEVRDSGEGIPAAVIDRIFDPFFTTKPIGVGTGLGLSICHSIITGLGGTLTVKSLEGRGTSFRVALPASSANHVQVASAPSAPPASARRASVLVVDDEFAVGDLLRRVLREHDVTVFTRARQALELLGSGAQFDVILSDLMMPEMSGMEFFEQLTEHFPESAARTVFVSGGAFTPAARAFLDRVTNERVEKPFEPKRMRQLVQRLLQRSSFPALRGTPAPT
ncbi:MAG: ATP-binding protein [Polyangiaceae bacterium]